MSPLDAARRLAGHSPVADFDVGYGCHVCEGPADIPIGDTDWRVDHKPDCPWLALPRIIAALEAAERVAEIDALGDQNGWVDQMAQAVDDLGAALQPRGAD
jgi:hypothetical protein